MRDLFHYEGIEVGFLRLERVNILGEYQLFLKYGEGFCLVENKDYFKNKVKDIYKELHEDVEKGILSKSFLSPSISSKQFKKDLKQIMKEARKRGWIIK
ncbi:hypothetical protein [Ornithobacterium rhinotracheale]|uniref:hypothetical protein n=1 Tax=Ornithobacterium rhinotracheale TaxID=28251 RepID=UPI004036E949